MRAPYPCFALVAALTSCTLLTEADLDRLEPAEEPAPDPANPDAGAPDALDAAMLVDASPQGCPAGLADCDDGPGLDCRDLEGDPSNCGGCDWVCWGIASICSRGACGELVLDCLFCGDWRECCSGDGLLYCFDVDAHACGE